MSQSTRTSARVPPGRPMAILESHIGQTAEGLEKIDRHTLHTKPISMGCPVLKHEAL